MMRCMAFYKADMAPLLIIFNVGFMQRAKGKGQMGEWPIIRVECLLYSSSCLTWEKSEGIVTKLEEKD